MINIAVKTQLNRYNLLCDIMLTYISATLPIEVFLFPTLKNVTVYGMRLVIIIFFFKKHLGDLPESVKFVSQSWAKGKKQRQIG